MSDYDGAEHMEEEPAQQQPRIKSTVVGGKKKGRGFHEPDRGEDGNAPYESLQLEGQGGGASAPAKSVEGWVLFITGLHEEAQEEDVAEAFADYGDVKNVYLNLDRQTGYVKGYALIEYATEKEAREAMQGLNGTELLGQTIHINWAFVRGGSSKGGRRGR